MSSLSEQNIAYIAGKINTSTIQSSQMKEDLIDHFCCAIEEAMKKGMSFEAAYDMAYQHICPDGFDEIQRETVFLLTNKKLKTMKRLMYVSGYLTAIGITTTFLMKVNHFPGAAIVLLLTAANVIFLFLPSLFLQLYKRRLSRTTGDKLGYLSGMIGFMLLIAFAMFKIAHWPGSTLLIVTSLVVINFTFFPFWFFKMYRKSV
jgi:hypothetical protein